MNVEEVVREFFHGIPSSGESTILVAVSGGKDSMVLLSVLEKLKEKFGFSLAVAHFNHKARGMESEKDETFVGEFASEKLGLPFYLGCGEVSQRAKEEKKSFEEMARILRYDFLQETAEDIHQKTQKVCYIATAHHGQDNLETFLLNLLRGAGLQGLSGIPPRRGNILRPLLKATRAEIEEFVRVKSLPYREDLSNQEETYRRNLLRHQVIGKLKELNPKVEKSSGKTIEIIRGENEFLNQYVEEKLVISQKNDEIFLERDSFLSLPDTLHGRAVQVFVSFMSKGKSEISLNGKHREEILSLIKREKPSGEFFIYDLHISRRYDKIIMKPRLNSSECFGNSGLKKEEVSFLCDKWTPWEKFDIFMEQVDKKSEKSGNSEIDEFTCGNVKELRVRTRVIGDEIKCNNRPTKSLKKWMIEEKIPFALRETLPIFVNEENQVVAVYWGGTFFVDCRFNLEEGTLGFLIKLRKREEERDGTI